LDPENNFHWMNFYQRQDRELPAYEGNNPPQGNMNAVGRKVWWGVSGHTVAAVFEHIAAGNHRRFTYSPPARWAPRRMDIA
jgi:hypothetical protein